VRLAGDYKPTRKKLDKICRMHKHVRYKKIGVMTTKVPAGIKTGKHKLTMKNKTHCSL